MYHKSKTPYGAKIINVSEILPEIEGQKSDCDRVYIRDLGDSSTDRISCIYRDAFERDYEPLGEGDFCRHCGSIVIDGIVGNTPKDIQAQCGKA